MSLRFEILGPLSVLHDGEPLALGGQKQKKVLAALILSANQVVSVDKLMQDLWEEEEPLDAPHIVQVYISNLRKLFRRSGDERRISTRSPGYLLAIDGDELDSADFDARAARGSASLEMGNHAQAIEELASALDLWRGEVLEDLSYGPFVRADALRLQEAKLNAIEDLTEARLLAGQGRAVVPDLESLITSHPERERPIGLLMTALNRERRSPEALAVFERYRQSLADGLGLDPSAELADLHRRILRQEEDISPNPISSVRRRAGNLPLFLTSLFGRENELSHVTASVKENRLTSLTGPAGTGKTRLAVEAARLMVDRTVVFVDLAPISGVENVGPAVMRSIGRIGADEDFAEAVAGLDIADGLLVMDNCEHVIDGVAAVVERILTATDQVGILATSREQLRIPGEHLIVVPPLSVPETDAADEAPASAAVQLFVDRVHATSPESLLTDRDLELVTHACRILGGLPLALELAAAWTGVMSLQEVLDVLVPDPGSLTALERVGNPAHASLGEAFDRSYRLLASNQAAHFDALSVFASPFTMQAVGYVLRLRPPEVALQLSGLVSRSLLTPVEDSVPRRMRLLAPARAYASSHLSKKRASDLSERHAKHFLIEARSGEDHLTGPLQDIWRDRLMAEIDDIASAVTWSLSHGMKEIAFEMVSCLWWLWGGAPAQAMPLLEACMKQSPEPADPLGARILATRGLVAFMLGDDPAAPSRRVLEYAATDPHARVMALTTLGSALRADQPDEARQMHEQALNESIDSALPWWEARSELSLGFVALQVGDLVEARRRCEVAAALFRDLEDRASAFGEAESFLGHCAYVDGRLADADAHYRRVLEGAVGSSLHLDDRAITLMGLGNVRLAQEADQEAMQLYAEAAQCALEGRFPLETAEALERMAIVTSRTGDNVLALRLLACAERIHSAPKMAGISGFDRFDIAALEADARTALGPALASSTWEEGADLAGPQLSGFLRELRRSLAGAAEETLRR